MSRRLTLDSVKQYVEENSDCELMSSEYKNVDEKLTFKCSCGNEFQTSFYKFKSRNKRQCNDCGRIKIAESKKASFEEVKRFIEIESGSGCQLLSTSYKNAQEKLKIKCECGEIFYTKFNHFKSSFQRQCQACGQEIVASQKRLDKNEVENYIESQGCKLLSDYVNSTTFIRIKCHCGNEFETLFSMFRDYDITSCRVCREKQKSRSKGESKIQQWLTDNGIEFIAEYKSEDLKHDRCLRFDFAILNREKKVKLFIEYDGKQHFGLGLFSSDQQKMVEKLNIIRQSDFSKNEYCFRNGIPLLRIPYNKYAKINEILTNSLL